MTKHYRLFSLLLALPTFIGASGCGCDPSMATMPTKCTGDGPTCNDPKTGEMRCLDNENPCLATHPDGTWTCDPTNVKADSTCSMVVCGDDSNSACQPPPPLSPGLLSFYLDSTVTPDGTIHYSGYSPGAADTYSQYDDLVVGSFTPSTYADGTRNLVTGWKIIDGVPLGAAPVGDVTGWRGGIGDPGDDSGKYSSITSLGSDLYVSYENTPADGSAKQLKVAYGTPTTAGGSDYTWTTFVIDSMAGGALYTSIAIVNGVPTVAYGVRVQASGPGLQPQGFVRIASAPSATPTGAWDSTTWTFASISSTTTNLGCVSFDNLCASGDTCVLDGTTGRGFCATPVDNTMCVTATAPSGCSSGSCFHENEFNRTVCSSAKTSEDMPNYTGMFNNLIPTGTGTTAALVYYDRSFGIKDAATTRCDLNTQCGATYICAGGIVNTAAKEGYCIAPGGSLWGVNFGNDPTQWNAAGRFVIDGYARKGTTQTSYYDAGIGATLAVDPATGNWHVAYMDGVFQRELYARVTNAGAGTVSTPELIDNGFPNGPGEKHIQGSNASLAIAGTTLKLVYSDETGLEARLASRDLTSAVVGLPTLATTWTLSTPPFPGTATSIQDYGFSRGFWCTNAVDATNQSWTAWLERVNYPQTLPSGGMVGSLDDVGDTLVYKNP